MLSHCSSAWHRLAKKIHLAAGSASGSSWEALRWQSAAAPCSEHRLRCTPSFKRRQQRMRRLKARSKNEQQVDNEGTMQPG